MNNGEGKHTRKVLGGSCVYNHYKGRAEIVTIIPKVMRDRDAPSYQTYEVYFLFQPARSIKASLGWVEGRRYRLTLTNGWYPGPEYLKKYGIAVGSTLDCILMLITQGSCNPIIFDFPGIDLSDYFENQR